MKWAGTIRTTMDSMDYDHKILPLHRKNEKCSIGAVPLSANASNQVNRYYPIRRPARGIRDPTVG